MVHQKIKNDKDDPQEDQALEEERSYSILGNRGVRFNQVAICSQE